MGTKSRSLADEKDDLNSLDGKKNVEKVINRACKELRLDKNKQL